MGRSAVSVTVFGSPDRLGAALSPVGRPLTRVEGQGAWSQLRSLKGLSKTVTDTADLDTGAGGGRGTRALRD